MNLIDKITAKQIRTDLPEIRVGYTVCVNVKIVEGKRERIQAFQGIVMAIQNGGVSQTFIVRKKSAGIAVERTFPMNSPIIDSIEIIKTGKPRSIKSKARRANLNYVRKMLKEPKF